MHFPRIKMQENVYIFMAQILHNNKKASHKKHQLPL